MSKACSVYSNKVIPSFSGSIDGNSNGLYCLGLRVCVGLLNSFDQQDAGFPEEQLAFSQLGYCHPSKRVENKENDFQDEVFESLTI